MSEFAYGNAEREQCLPVRLMPTEHTVRRRCLLHMLLGVPFGALSCSSRDDSRLVVGGLPVTCNLTLPVACTAKKAAGSPGTQFEYAKYSGWPEIKESLMAGRIQAAYMLAPLVMDLAAAGVPLKIVSLGHRSGAVIMVRSDSPYRVFRQ